MNIKPKVYIADLRHVAGGLIANSCMPLGIGYMKAVMDRDLPEVESWLFTYPDQLLDAMKSDAPDVLMLTNYVWNERLTRSFTSIAKRLQQNTLVVAGGPNIPIETKRQIKFFDNWKDLDVYALGKGDFLATEIVSRFLDANKSITTFINRGVPSSLCRSEGETVHQPEWDNEFKLEEIPSPWLNGVQDQFFDGNLIPLMETNRGCPFKCTFCVQGTDSYNRISHFEENRVKEELSYVARRVKELCPNMGVLNMADSNFGMYKRDIAIAAHIGALQEKYSWPTYLDISTGKNTPDLIIQAIEKTNGSLGFLQSVQSMNDDVLRSIKRSNIKLDTYKTVTKYLTENGIRTASQTILALPRETLQSHISGLHQLIDSDIDSIQNFQLILINGSEIETQDSRAKFGFKTKFRLTIRGFGVYGGKHVFDMEEVVVGTESLSFDDYIHARTYHLIYAVFWSQNWFKDLFLFAKNFGIKNSTCLDALVREMSCNAGVLDGFIKTFIEETKNELFDTPEECARYYSDAKRFEKLMSGEIGDNAINRNCAKASFLLWPEICKLATRVIKRLILTHSSNGPDPKLELFWTNLCQYVESKHAHGSSVEEILAPTNCELQYDVSRWVADGHPKILLPYKLETSKTFLFKLSKNNAKEIRDAIETWSANLQGLTKVVRYTSAKSQVRECI